MRVTIICNNMASDPELHIDAKSGYAREDTGEEYESIQEEAGFRAYLDKHGWHFSEKLAAHAVGKMRKADGTALVPFTNEQVGTLLRRHNAIPLNSSGHDVYYVANMAYADYYGSSITDDASLAAFIKDYIDDADGYDGKALRHYHADCAGKGETLPWREML